jgi:DNA-binding NarL/FixJ family response regulator
MAESLKEAARIVIVEDHALVRAGLRLLIERDPGLCVVAECDNGRDAILAVAELNPDAVMMDLTMPGMNGIDLSYAIRERFPSIPVAIVSGDVSELERSIIGRADVPFIKKPFHAESLYSAVKDAIRLHSPSRS